jgi:transposase
MSTPSTTTSTKADSFRRVEVITGVGRRRRWTDEEKAWIVAESLDPATTVSAVARRYGLHASQLFVWRQRLAAPAAREAPEFVPVVVAEECGGTGRDGRPDGDRARPGRRTRRRGC